MPLEPPSPLLRPGAAVRSIGQLPGFTEPATGADLSADGTLLAVCSYTVTRVYRRASRMRPWQLLAEVRYAAAADRGDRLGRARPDPGRRGGRGLYRLSEQTWRAGCGAAGDAAFAARPRVDGAKRETQ